MPEFLFYIFFVVFLACAAVVAYAYHRQLPDPQGNSVDVLPIETFIGLTVGAVFSLGAAIGVLICWILL